MPDLCSGVLGIPDGEWCEFGEPRTAGFTRMEGDHELHTVLRATDTHRNLDDEYIATSGDAAREEAIKDKRTRVDAEENSIGEVSERRKIAHRTNWLMIPDRFVIVERSSGTFVFHLIAEQGTATIKRAEIDLLRLQEAYPDVSEWAHGPDGFVKGTLYGHEETLKELPEASNQLGLKGNFDGFHTKMVATRSGYIAAWDLETEQFARFLNEVILPFAGVPEEDEKDEDQTGMDDFADEVADELDEQGVDYERGVTPDA